MHMYNDKNRKKCKLLITEKKQIGPAEGIYSRIARVESESVLLEGTAPMTLIIYKNYIQPGGSCSLLFFSNEQEIYPYFTAVSFSYHCYSIRITNLQLNRK